MLSKLIKKIENDIQENDKILNEMNKKANKKEFKKLNRLTNKLCTFKDRIQELEDFIKSI